MRRNIGGPKRSARLRSEQAMERTSAALQRMDASNQEIIALCINNAIT
jgi:hypothetical protein